MSFHDPQLVAEEYATEKGLLGRRAAYKYADGPDAHSAVVEAVLEGRPRHVLEVGCGPGEAAERIAATGANVEAVDVSERMVELTRARGVSARVGDVQKLPFEDDVFEAALAAWMLYHVADVDGALSELARVLRPGGRLVAVTNGVDHLGELRGLLGGEFPTWHFSDQNARGILERHFDQVEERDLGGWIHFPDRATVQSYVDATQNLWKRDLPADFDGPLRVRYAPILYVASR